MFLELNNKLINIDNVSNILFDKNKFKVDFQFANSINILGKETSDFFELKFPYKEDIDKLKLKLKENHFIRMLFLFPPPNIINNEEWVNISHINTISLDDTKCKIIFNLDYGIDIVDKNTEELIKISKFIYWKFETCEEAEKEYEKLKSILVKLN